MEEQTVAELEFENARLHVDLNLTRFDGCMLMVDRLLSMHNHVQNYGIDRTFLALYNKRNLLSKVCDVRFPACEDVLSDYDLNRQYFEACMEGLGRAIKDAFKWVIEKIKALFNWIGEMWKKFWGLFKNKTEANKKLIAKLEELHLKDDAEFDTKYISPDTLSKFNEIMNKIGKNTDLLDGTGLSWNEFTQIRTYLDNLKFDSDKENEAVKVIQIKDDHGKTTALDIAKRDTDGFDKLSVAIGTAIKSGQMSLDKFEKQQAALDKAHSAMSDGDNKTKIGTDINKIKESIKLYREKVSTLSKLLKLVLDGTTVTNKMLKMIGEHCSYVQNSSNYQIEAAQNKVNSQIPQTNS